jgi:predicted RNase H-like nuclease (RuvC/YqgF family)
MVMDSKQMDSIIKSYVKEVEKLKTEIDGLKASLEVCQEHYKKIFDDHQELKKKYAKRVFRTKEQEECGLSDHAC